MKLQYQLSNGNWSNCDQWSKSADQFISDCEKINHMTRDEVIDGLLAGRELRIGTNWYSNIRSGAAHEARQAVQQTAVRPIKMVKCSCGHTVPAESVMAASLGSSCPDCYDKMSN